MLEVKTLNEVSLIDFVNLVNEVFKDYTIPINWDVLNFRLDLRENSLTLDLSYVFLENGKPVGFIVTGVRKDRGRIDAMGVVREKRGTGLAQKILHHALEALKWKGVERVILEVASDDARAVRFYQKNGFRELRNLYTMAKRNPEVLDVEGFRMFKTDPRWIHRAAIEAEITLQRKPNWQREPLTLLLSNGRYNLSRVIYRGEEGFAVWGTTPDSAFIVDASPLKNARVYSKVIEGITDSIFRETRRQVITISSVPEDDPLYKAAKSCGYEAIFQQKEMCFKLPS